MSGEIEAIGTVGVGDKFASIPEPLRQQAHDRGFTPETLDRFAWGCDPFGNLYVIAYDVSLKEDRPKASATGFR